MTYGLRFTYPRRNLRIASLSDSPRRSAASAADFQSASSTRTDRSGRSAIDTRSHRPAKRSTDDRMVCLMHSGVRPDSGEERLSDLGSQWKRDAQLGGVRLADPAVAFDGDESVVRHGSNVAHRIYSVNTRGATA